MNGFVQYYITLTMSPYERFPQDYITLTTSPYERYVQYYITLTTSPCGECDVQYYNLTFVVSGTMIIALTKQSTKTNIKFVRKLKVI